MLNLERCWIAPTLREAKEIAQIFLHQGDGRGFWEEHRDGTLGALVLFDSYGATHSTAKAALKLPFITSCIIVQKSGDVAFEDLEDDFPIEKLVTPSEALLFNRIKHYMGGEGPCLATAMR